MGERTKEEKYNTITKHEMKKKTPGDGEKNLPSE